MGNRIIIFLIVIGAIFIMAQSEKQEYNELTPEEERVIIYKGTEAPFTGKYNDFKSQGIYRCVCCGNELFSSETKFNSGSGWPSFWAPIAEQNIKTRLINRFI